MHIFNKMKFLLPVLVIWLLSNCASWVFGDTPVAAGIGYGIKREIFFLNLEDGYFGCQVNQSTDVLQLYELSRLCDGRRDCFQGSDELRRELKCTENCLSEAGIKCQHGACLDSQCHCNDGFGGCSCEVADENECKYRPCDVFAHCTNTLGSFHCSCFPGYTGDGFHCHDINECEDPAIASRCVPNAECCNVPAHFVCKCKPGFEGDGEIECRDIDECRHPNACGHNAICYNTPGNYTCECKQGFAGNPFLGCSDFDECSLPHACGPGAKCNNFPGGYHCECAPGYTGDAYHNGCVDINECLANPCGKNALCKNVPGSFKCSCPAGSVGDPFQLCTAIGCTSDNECDVHFSCISGQCENPCQIQNPCQYHEDCEVKNHRPICVTGKVPQPSCDHCPPGVPCDPTTGACAKAPGTAKRPQPCQLDTDCLETEACYNEECEDICSITNLCAPTAKCHVVKHRPVCTCPPGYQGNPAIRCYLPKTLNCFSDVDCTIHEVCIEGTCQQPCSIHNPCAQNALCINTNHGADCSCIEGYQGNGFVGCKPVEHYQLVCQYNEDCPPDKLCDRLNRVCISPCFEDSCGENAECVPKNHGTDCRCLSGYQGNPYVSCGSVKGCRHDNECAPNEACINGKCSTPCRCGLNAVCEVFHHKASCKCLPGYTGNPATGCLAPQNPCDPNPCGLHALCELDNGNPICFCPKGMTGNPFTQCIPEGDECTPNPCGPNSGCRVVHGSAVCFCLPEFEGDPPITQCRLPKNPCQPSPCGPNTQCTLLSDGFARCTCLPGYVESPNTVRGCVEKRNPCDPNPCGFGAICDPNRPIPCFCPEPLLGNPYKQCSEPTKTLCQPGPCGNNADCYVTGSIEQCYCKPGYQGDPYISCKKVPINVCTPNPCGPHAACSISSDGHAICTCPPGVIADPISGSCSGLECTADEDCSLNKACVSFRCQDPCPGSCGIGASCRVEKHHPVCTCNHGLTGNPLIRCFKIEALLPGDPCTPNPCGVNAYCSISDKHPVCSCLDNFVGDPRKGCYPECVLNTDCSPERVCVNYRCKDPCKEHNVCGLGAVCLCRDHTPTCICKEGTMGNPFLQCVPKPDYPQYPNQTLPCTPSPCDPTSQCHVYGGQIAMCDPCSVPSAQFNPSCHPECLSNADCSFSRACLGHKCLDPCPGSCGINALCQVVNHSPVCSCPPSLSGNPYEHCSPLSPVPTPEPDHCHRDRCGANAVCKNVYGHIVCECHPGYYGNPHLACHPECVLNTDCEMTKACLNNKCVNPCSGVCGINAECEVVNHVPVCFCAHDYTGDPLMTCYPYRPYLPPPIGKPGNPCDPSPCGPNSRCLISSQGYATCSCLPGYYGSPPLCKPECIVSAECPQTHACVNQKCVDPCAGICGYNARCFVVNHNPICSCPTEYVGDPFVKCTKPTELDPKIPGNPCDPSPCGSYSICQVKEGHPVCSCIDDYFGSPPYCRPQCTMNQECPSEEACFNGKCRNPCTAQSCGSNAKCYVLNHTPYCSCLAGYEGDAFVSCGKIPPTAPPEIPRDPCVPNPCGENTQCFNENGIARCSCIPPYIGNPYSGGCRPECVINSDCPPNAACLSSHCRDPCPGVCGINAECTVFNHVPSCSCFPDYIGDPFKSCRRKPATPILPQNPCQPSPCGPNSRCEVSRQRALCSCSPGFVGTPPNCRPECVSSAECNPHLACISQKCADPCPGTCGLHAICNVVNHNPICSCPPNTAGDPFIRCVEIEPKPTFPLNPCSPSPCGANSECKVLDHRPVCSCVTGMLGAPPYCRPECMLHADCPTKLACINNKCRDPCVGSCGFNSQCTVVNHQPVCACNPDFQGDPFFGCNPIPVKPTAPPDPCNPSPCGANAICKERNGVGSCLCLPQYIGDPYTGCRPECVLNSECSYNLACINNKCVDPCTGVCGTNAECRVINHAPSCSCINGYTGNPLIACHLLPPRPSPTPKNPCLPSPCGPYSQCRPVDDHAVCSCQKDYIGIPPACRPECMVSSECPQDKACIKQKCSDPCTGICAPNARCQVVNHNPICSCSSGYTGDPFVRCVLQQPPEIQPRPTPENPCIPTPCGPNSRCREIGNTAACSCLLNYIGRPPNCRPECTINEECPNNLACQNDRCVDPCPGSCGAHATCLSIKHVPRCSCEVGYTGDPFSGCFQIQQLTTTEGPKNPCNPSPCGANAICKERNGAGSCVCLPEYFGDPYTGCRPECVTNADCDRLRACVNNKCRDPCPGTCGLNAKCTVANHAPSCSCLPGYTGDPISACRLIPSPDPEIPRTNPCLPSPCGPYSQCRPIDGHAVCSCQNGYIGTPPACRPECIVSSECAQDKACISQKCADPCVGTCGINARCQVINHNPICSCAIGYTGNPFVSCLPIVKPSTEMTPSGNPCVPSPCGPYSECRLIGSNPACSCLPNYIGRPPNCRPECTINEECAGNLACQNEKCRDPCPGSCGLHTVCVVVNHAPQCTCEGGFTGDPFAGCTPQIIATTEKPRDPCNPSPCGANAVCKERNGVGSCVCLPAYFGDPYTGCRPECVTNSDCDRNKACLNNKCQDPCPGTCGLHAECRVTNHAPICYCLPGYTGDPISSCVLLPSTAPTPIDPCDPSPCGPNSICKEINLHAVCSCITGFIGTPPLCRPECVVSSECAQDKACMSQKCDDPCPGRCGRNSRCQVVNHNPICSCSPGFTGDPFTQCSAIPSTTIAAPPDNPCKPSPCGPYSQCRVINNTPACSCLNNYVGQPPNCRPECVIDAECPANRACKKERCSDPCPGSCGQSAICSVIHHNPTCSCPPGYTGDALVACFIQPTSGKTPDDTNPCIPSPCGVNAECINRNSIAACKCIDGYFGDPYAGCRRECETNNDCALPLACVGYKCLDPCPGTCGTLSICTVVNHVPICSCPPAYTGDPFFSCKPIPISTTPVTPRDPCFPSPCGPNSQCKQVNQQAVCTCMPNYMGPPPHCRPECIVNSECPLDKACINQRCSDPCPNTCGLYAQCNVKNHSPFCSCPPQFTGDPFLQCSPIPAPSPTPTEEPPSCVPSPCGPNSQCKIIGGSPVCSCLPDYVGSPPSCRPECILSSECASQLACINQHCKDPCPGSCGVNAVCHVLNHIPVCTCIEDHTGDPFALCSPIPITTPKPQDPCNPSPCGPNAICHADGSCECLPEYTGNPYEACRPECVLSIECSRDKACMRNKCKNPCPGTCGQSANCDVINHIPVCSCPPDMTGDPFTLCKPVQADKPHPVDPCNPSPCGPNSQCRQSDGHAVCSCLSGYIGTPPSCRPECIANGECSPIEACVNMKCINPCVGSCGIGARCEVINHSPICSCREGQTGDPFRSCYDIPVTPLPPPEPDRNPCIPSPCGPNSVCQEINKQPSCSCLQDYVGLPPNCRPECVINPDCPRNQACINNKCRDPCPGSCGLNAVCQVISHAVSCTCSSGFTGNPFEQCSILKPDESVNPCEPSPCGANAICKQQNGIGSCTCITDYQGNPYEGCRPECVLSADCPADKACIRNKCQDPCPGICGISATCSVINHIPTCICIDGYEGDPFVNCHAKQAIPTLPSVVYPCRPSPCGPNSNCRENNGQAVCSCLPDFQGSPPDCKPECVVNSECPTNRACYKYKCKDPCPGTCGLTSNCGVINHHPICSCPPGFTGDPFYRCYQMLPDPIPPYPVQPTNPCVPSPCGPNSECHVTGSQASCRCIDNYIGAPPNCRPECSVNTDCSPTLACISEKCRDPCIGSCGVNAECHVQNHIPICSCLPDYTGDSFTQCSPIIVKPAIPQDPCNPSPCGLNANCRNGICTCINSNYFGDPYVGCRPECTLNTDCSPNKACINQRCIDPCPGTCGQGAKCEMVNHIPTCTCPPQTTGDAFTACRNIPQEVDRGDPCKPSPCGPNSVCQVRDNHAVCSCQPGLIGSPPSCRPECISSAECQLTEACLINKCRDPCPGTCGLNARCQVVNHNPICSCPQGYNGDPFRHCQLMPVIPPKQPEPINPCSPSPCGPNSVCQIHEESPACSCLPNYIGLPPNCRPECTINPECSNNLACINQKCTDPCIGSCGSNAVCSVVNHIAVCSCIAGYNGDPFSSCTPAIEPPTTPKPASDPCYPSPCGSNARCRIENSFALCECLPEFQGNPYEGCRPECLVSSDCAMNKACIKNKCQDPCPATCGFGAICTVSNHIPICYCPEDKTGDAFHYCEPIPRTPTPTDPCVPSPCGPNTRCQVSNNYAVCECLPGFQGSPSTSGCRPECVINSDCSRDKACVNNKCVDPCPGVCGYRAICHTINHSPICSCPSPLQGDPFSECRDAPAVPVDPCNPSPCRQDGQCRVMNGVASCIYPECIINQDCPRDKACFTQKCKDPCVGACGINAICQVVNHEAVCSCPPGYYGQPKLQCRQEIQPEPKPECLTHNDCPNNKACINRACKDPCRETANVCASNAECRTQQHRPYCFCKDGLTGDAHTYCYEIGCRTDTDCLPSEACVNRQCTNPCAYTQCGINALCRVDYNHKARCYCPDNYDGNPLITCERPQCITDLECPAELACQNQKCQNPCRCAPSALCRVNEHIPSCSCPPGYTGNPQVSCTIEPLKPPTQCKMDADCASKLACFSGVCRNPCTEAKPCGINADCTVVDTLPVRTMTCLCRPGYVGDADFECKKEPQYTPGCASNEECASTEICVNRQCVNPCAIKNPCAPTGNCQSYNHKAVCKCPEGFVGDPFVNCYKVPVTLPECTADSDCPTTRACINNHCQVPCEVSNPCGQFAECTTIQHRPICNCPDGWAGSPQGFCYKPECETDNDCLYDKACRNKNCINPCTTVSCGAGAECEVRNHASQCVCPTGTQGNPLLSCVSVGCQYNEDCADYEICDRLNRKCYPVCEKDACAVRASCTAKEHQKICSCLPGTEGNPYVECTESPMPKTECTKDTECPTQLACINRKCQNPCSFLAVCSPDQECQVQDTHPVRTVMCICPPDSIASDDGHCKPIVPVQQCQSDNQCPESERCVQGRCIDVCKIDPCGLNALCIQKTHQAVCLCPPGYTGNAHIECSSYPIISLPPTLPECVRNDDCSLYHSCINEKCVNPCSINNACGKDSFCHVEGHQPECRCPVGYEGNPKIKCIPVEGLPITGCVSNSECASHEACVNNVCINPCNCGPNAQCHVFDHYPMCYCKPGFSGNPQFGCVKVGCENDDQCAYDKVCYNGDCINPCIVGDPCAINAQCYGDNHRAACRCPSGHTGDPFVRCEIAECHIDADCPSDKACLNQHCINPCTDVVNPPCASNAICYTRNHAAGCRCPDYLPLGNPLSYCEKSTPPSSEPECKLDVHCPSKLACIGNRCVNPCTELSPCPSSSKCTVLDSIPIRTLICTCPEGWVPDKDEECRPVIVPKPPGCISDSECSSNETCVNRICRDPCNCGLNAHCFIQNHRPICSCKDGYEGNPNIACRSIGCKRDTECESGKACIRGNCVNPCTGSYLCGTNAECYTYGSSPQCRCVSGYRGNPYEECSVIGCRSNNDCPSDRACNNAQCVNPCFYGNPCSPEASCNVKNHLAICRCPTGMTGNPYTSCHTEPKTECKQDSDCPQFLACFNERCQNPCSVLEPCQRPAECEVVNTLPVRTMLCVCPSGYVSSGSGTCKATPAITAVGCLNDEQCPEDRSCVKGVCINPCNCGLRAECYIKEHKPVCVCVEEYEGNPNTECIPVAGCKVDSDCSGQNQCVNRKCVPACAPDKTTCGRDAICYGINHRAVCECPPGLTGNPIVSCTLVTCKSDSDCPSEKSCENKKCVNPCERKDDCVPPAVCIPYNHRAECSCPTGYIQDITGCKKSVAGCKSDSECPSQTACINNVCVEPCESIKPCALNTECKVFDTAPVKTMTCHCLPGFEGNAAVICIELSKCATDKGFIRTKYGGCICPPGTALNVNKECRRCVIEQGYKIDENGHCVCALDRGLIINERGQCVCLAEHGYVLDYYGNCVPIKISKCESNDTCADDEYCNTRSGNCENPCESKVCGIDAYCRATDHRAICVCIDKFEGNPEVQCHPPSRKQFPRAQMNVNCLADGIQVQIKLEDPDFDGVLYVKGYSKDEECRRIISVPRDTRLIMENFKVNFGTCGLIHMHQQASFILVVQKHPTLVTYRAQAYHIKCVYTASEQNITIGFNVSMLTTAGTIANTGPPPTCSMKIVTKSGQEISTAEIGENLMLQVDVQPSSIYSGFARSCIAKTTDNNVENEYIVTDENGCATDSAIFGEWDCDTETQSLVAEFNAFKFPTSDNIRFQCNIRVCFGKCQPVKCNGYNAYGRRKREISGRNYTGSTEITPVPRGHLREEITIESNAILTFERKESRLINPTEQPQTQKIEDICISIIGLVTALIITALLALVAVAVAVSCWLMAFRKRPQTSGPLPHPPEFPNPIFTSNQQLQEPSPDYLST